MQNNCPTSQRKSLSGLDNVTADGPDSFGLLLKITAEVKNSHEDLLNELKIIKKQLRDGKKYTKGEYKNNCSNNCDDISDHCRIFALSDPKEKCYQQLCSVQHENHCQIVKPLQPVLKI